MKYLGLDIGTARTGVAFADSEDDILFSLETLTHASQEELVEHIATLYKERSIDEVVLGLPLLPSGDEGSQVDIVRSLSEALIAANINHSLLDERYTTPKSSDLDPDAAAACEILAVKLSQK